MAEPAKKSGGISPEQILNDLGSLAVDLKEGAAVQRNGREITSISRAAMILGNIGGVRDTMRKNREAAALEDFNRNRGVELANQLKQQNFTAGEVEARQKAKEVAADKVAGDAARGYFASRRNTGEKFDAAALALPDDVAIDKFAGVMFGRSGLKTRGLEKRQDDKFKRKVEGRAQGRKVKNKFFDDQLKAITTTRVQTAPEETSASGKVIGPAKFEKVTRPATPLDVAKAKAFAAKASREYFAGKSRGPISKMLPEDFAAHGRASRRAEQLMGQGTPIHLAHLQSVVEEDGLAGALELTNADGSPLKYTGFNDDEIIKQLSMAVRLAQDLGNTDLSVMPPGGVNGLIHSLLEQAGMPFIKRQRIIDAVKAGR